MICVCSWLLVRSGASFIFKNVRLLCFSWFLFCHNEIWNDRLKGLKQQRIYSSNRQIFVETDIPKTWEQVLLSYTFLYLLHLHFGCALSKIGLGPPTRQERMQMGLCLRWIDSCRLHNKRLCCACLPKIQSVIIRGIHV